MHIISLFVNIHPKKQRSNSIHINQILLERWCIDLATDERRREWAKNFGKSVGYSAKVSLTSIAPNVSTTAGSVVEVVRDIRQLGTKIKNLHRQEDTQLSKTKLGKSAKNIFDTAMNDLRTGNFGMRKEVGNNIDDLSSFLDDELDSTYSFGDDDTDLSELSPEEINHVSLIVNDIIKK